MSNVRRVFSDLLGFRAWHEKLDDHPDGTPVHVDLTFKGKAKIGSEKESPVTFVLELRRAEVMLILRETEPGTIPPTSLSYDCGETKTVKKKSRTVKASLAGEVDSSGTASGSGNVGYEDNAEWDEVTHDMLVMHSAIQTSPGVGPDQCDEIHGWEIVPHGTKTLKGKPWDAIDRPRAHLSDERPDGSNSPSPTLNVVVRCRREDLKVSSIKWKEGKITLPAAKTAAAEQFIKERLQFAQLETPDDISEDFSELTLIDAAVQELSR